MHKQTFAIYALSDQGANLAMRLANKLGGQMFFAQSLSKTLEHDEALEHCEASEYQHNYSFFESLAEQLKLNFKAFNCHILICASGIAVRCLAPLLESKTCDPAVLLLDQQGKYVISFLSGHLGGANQLAKFVADKIKATPIITTATDLEGLPSIDLLAALANLKIANPEMIKVINAALLKKEKPLVLDKHNFLNLASTELAVFFQFANKKDLNSPAIANQKTVLLSYHKEQGLAQTLVLHPKILYLGVGCKKGTDPDKLYDFVKDTFEQKQWALSALKSIATIDLKQNELAILELQKRLRVNLQIFKAEELNSIAVPNPSAAVKSVTGSASVAEAAANLANPNPSTFLLTKTKKDGMTLALTVASSYYAEELCKN